MRTIKEVAAPYIDASSGYWHIPLDEESSYLTMHSQHLLIQTLKGTKSLFELVNVRIIGQILLGPEVHRSKKVVRIRDCTLFIEGTGLEIFTKASLKKSLPIRT